MCPANKQGSTALALAPSRYPLQRYPIYSETNDPGHSPAPAVLATTFFSLPSLSIAALISLLGRFDTRSANIGTVESIGFPSGIPLVDDPLLRPEAVALNRDRSSPLPPGGGPTPI